MPAIMVNSIKGGVGKSTTVSHLGVGLARKGLHVAVVDMCMQGHQTSLLGIDPETLDWQQRDGVFHLVASERPPQEVMVKVLEEGLGSLYLIPGSKRTQTAGVDIQIRQVPFGEVAAIFDELRATFEVVIFDTSPALGLLTPVILAASDHVIIPTQMNQLGLTGVFETIRTMTKLAGDHDAKLLGILPTMTNPRTLEYKEVLDILLDNFGETLVWADVQTTRSVTWEEAASVGQTVLDYPSANDKPRQQAGAYVEKVADILRKGYFTHVS